MHNMAKENPYKKNKNTAQKSDFGIIEEKYKPNLGYVG